MKERETIDIISGGEYPSGALSNFYPHTFVFDGVECASVEGLLQSLKTKNVALQRQVCALSGKKAKKFFEKRRERLRFLLTHRLYWKGKPIGRFSDDYARFLDAVYDEVSQSPSFADALLDSQNATLVHSIGKTDARKTVLTEYEFVSRLEKCRAALQKEMDKS